MGNRKRTDTPSLTITWSIAAIDDLAEIRSYVEVDKPEAAARLARKIVGAADRLTTVPESGRIGRARGTRELVIPGTPYYLVYRIQLSAVQILRVWHGKRIPEIDE